MTTKYTYESQCCGHVYIEQRGEDEPQYITVCNQCGNADYVLTDSQVVE